ncbi:MAG: ion transporter [Bacteroidales bacterium]|nr:ion transporter [Bacteroidales bacterium]
MSNKSIIKSFFTNDKIMLALVVINTITIFIGGYGRAAQAFLWIDAFFTLLFLIEALVKIRTYGWKDYWQENWNKFDFIITLVAVPSLLNIFKETGLATSVLLSLRSLRIFKSFRLLKFIPNINGLLKGIGLAIKASLIVSIAFVVLLLIISILSSTLFGKISPELFGDPGLSLFTIFRLFTGDGWSEIPTQIAENSNEFIGRLVRVVFAVMFFLGGILGLSLVNSIFVDAMADDNNDEVLQKLNELEKKLDKLHKE